MKQIFHKIMSLSMAVVVLFSTMSFIIDMHYCGDSLMNIAVFHKAETCGMEMEKPATKSCSIADKNCCDDEQTVVSGQDELQVAFNKITFEKQLFFTSFVYSYLSLFESVDKNETSFEDYKPPLVVREIYKIDETYII